MKDRDVYLAEIKSLFVKECGNWSDGISSRHINGSQAGHLAFLHWFLFSSTLYINVSCRILLKL